jgi:hypothetical protein
MGTCSTYDYYCGSYGGTGGIFIFPPDGGFGGNPYSGSGGYNTIRPGDGGYAGNYGGSGGYTTMYGGSGGNGGTQDIGGGDAATGANLNHSGCQCELGHKGLADSGLTMPFLVGGAALLLVRRRRRRN